MLTANALISGGASSGTRGNGAAAHKVAYMVASWLFDVELTRCALVTCVIRGGYVWQRAEPQKYCHSFAA